MHTPRPSPPRLWQPNPDGSVVLTPRAIKAIQALVLGVNEDKSPSLRALERALDEAQCNETDREAILYVLGLREHP